MAPVKILVKKGKNLFIRHLHTNQNNNREVTPVDAMMIAMTSRRFQVLATHEWGQISDGSSLTAARTNSHIDHLNSLPWMNESVTLISAIILPSKDFSPNEHAAVKVIIFLLFKSRPSFQEKSAETFEFLKWCFRHCWWRQPKVDPQCLFFARYSANIRIWKLHLWQKVLSQDGWYGLISFLIILLPKFSPLSHEHYTNASVIDFTF